MWKLSCDFKDRLERMRIKFSWTQDQINYLIQCMAFETGGTFSPTIRNMAGSGATGLIQFMPRTAIGLGTTTDALANMTAVEQLDYVERYFQPYYRRTKTLSDMYMAILMPKYIGYDDQAILFNDPSKAYTQNRGLDLNLDGRITKAEATHRVKVFGEK